jgi:hypothetical protein
MIDVISTSTIMSPAKPYYITDYKCLTDCHRFFSPVLVELNFSTTSKALVILFNWIELTGKFERKTKSDIMLQIRS